MLLAPLCSLLCAWGTCLDTYSYILESLSLPPSHIFCMQILQSINFLISDELEVLCFGRFSWFRWNNSYQRIERNSQLEDLTCIISDPEMVTVSGPEMITASGLTLVLLTLIGKVAEGELLTYIAERSGKSLWHHQSRKELREARMLRTESCLLV